MAVDRRVLRASRFFGARGASRRAPTELHSTWSMVPDRLDGSGPHYSRRTPGSETFTGVGREVVLDHSLRSRGLGLHLPAHTLADPAAGRPGGAWANRTAKPRHLWRNMMFRNLGAGLSSNLIADATEETYRQWRARYGELPPERLRTEIGVREVRSVNPGYCYLRAGWERGDTRNGKLFLWAPPM